MAGVSKRVVIGVTIVLVVVCVLVAFNLNNILSAAKIKIEAADTEFVSKNVRLAALMKTQTRYQVVGGPTAIEGSYMLQNLVDRTYVLFYPCTEEQKKLKTGNIVSFYYLGARQSKEEVSKEALPHCYLATRIE